MTALAAITLGSELAPRDFDAVVTGVFDRTCNIRLSSGCLVTCSTADYFDMPRGIRVDTSAGFSFQSAVRCKTSSHCRGGIVRFSGSNFQIDCRDASIWQGNFKPKFRPPAHLVNKLWEMAPSDIRENLSNFRPESLIGTGEGLTPAGDDILTGLLAAPMLVAPKQHSHQTLASKIRLLSYGTNEISREMLNDAAEGLFIEPVVSLLSAIYGNGDLQEAVRNLRAVGATSGVAMVMGIFAGVANVEGIQLKPISTYQLHSVDLI